jgi:hypothetical protein
MMSIFTVLAFAWFGTAPTCASDFLVAPFGGLLQHVGEGSSSASLLSEIDSAIAESGKGVALNDVSLIEATLRPVYSALPKNAHGHLDHTAARYGLHRFFMARHGWAIAGFTPAGGTYNTSSPAGVLKDQLPSYIEDVFEQRLQGRGFRLHELAVLAATIEHLIHAEAVQRLGVAFRMHDTFSKGALSGVEASEMLDTYIMAYILSGNLTGMTFDVAQKLRSDMSEVFSHWPETQQFVRNVHKNAKLASQGELGSASLATVARAVGEQFGEFLDNTACKHIKATLMQMEYRDSGRVRLSDFYNSAINGAVQFQESAAYLRELGVLEETDPRSPSVMIANYVVSPSNCVASSGLYTVCCKNECDGLLAFLEQNISAPVATPTTIAALVAELPSSTVSAPRGLTATSIRRLDEIAANHGGLVPLHGRLFMQWMHHAYPRECPFPHISGTTSPKSPEDWLQETNGEVAASDEEMRQYIHWSKDASGSDTHQDNLMAWSPEEELLLVHVDDVAQVLSALPSQTPAAVRSVLLFVIAGSLACALIQTMQATSYVGARAVPHKFVI